MNRLGSEFSVLRKVQTDPEAYRLNPMGVVSVGPKRPGPTASGQMQNVWSCVSPAHSSWRLATAASLLTELCAAPNDAATSLTREFGVWSNKGR